MSLSHRVSIVRCLAAFLTASVAFVACSDDETASPAASTDAGASGDTATASEGGGSDSSSGTDSSASSVITVTAAGGVFNVGGATLDVPAGAVSADKAITLELRAGAPTGTGLAGFTLITDVLVATPHGTTFAKPVTIDLPLKGAVTGAPEVRYVADDADTTWESLASASVVSGRLRFTTTHFSGMVGVVPGQGSDGGTDGAVVTDSSTPSDGGGLQAPQCFAYAPGGSSVGSQTLVRVADRLYWSTLNVGVSPNRVHTIKTDLTDYKSFANQVSVNSITSNVNGVFWFNTFPPADAGLTPGLFKLTSSTGTPTNVATVSGFPGLMAATDTNLFYKVQSGANYTLLRADGQGQSPTTLVNANYFADQLVIANGYIYSVESTLEATNTFCATSGNKVAQIKRVAVDAVAPATPELSVDGCAIQAITARFGEKLIRFATDGVHTYAQSDRGEIWKTPVAGGTPVRLFQPSAPLANMGGDVIIVGTNLVFKDQDSSVGVGMGMRKIPLAGGASTKFALPYGTTYAADANAIYFADQGSVCRLLVP